MKAAIITIMTTTMTTSTPTEALAPPAHLALARLPDRRLRLFARARMGGRSRRRQRRGHARSLARGRDRLGDRPQRSHPPPPRPPRRGSSPISRIAALAASVRAASRNPPARRGFCRRRRCLALRAGTEPAPYPVAVGRLGARNGIDGRSPRRSPISTPSRPLSSPPPSASSRSASRRASRVLAALQPLDPHDRRSHPRGHARGSRRRVPPLRARRHAPRNPIYEAVPLMSSATARSASASAARSAPARRR